MVVISFMIYSTQWVLLLEKKDVTHGENASQPKLMQNGKIASAI
jgi:hypothetical protein